MNHLLRELAPLSAEAWAIIDDEARRTLKLRLAGRKLVDFAGPLGWQHSAVELGRGEPIQQAPAPGAEGWLRRVQPLVEVRVPFEVERAEMEAAARGAKDADVDAVRKAAIAAALAEDRALFHGYAGAGIRGLMEAGKDAAMPLTSDYEKYPGVVAGAIHKLHTAGVDGPYAIALGPRCYMGLTTTTDDGFPVIEHVRRLLNGPIVWAPAVDGAAVLSLRGGDFELTVGADFSIAYLEHSASTVRLCLQESFTFRVLSPEAVVPLSYASKGER
jgi:uncharacterized linocin/CFP29 family protein